MRYSLALVAAFAAQAFAAYNATIHLTPDCGDSNPIYIENGNDIPCTSLNGLAYTSIRVDEPGSSQNCFFSLWGDEGCSVVTEGLVSNDGECAEFEEFRSYRVQCYEI